MPAVSAAHLHIVAEHNVKGGEEGGLIRGQLRLVCCSAMLYQRSNRLEQVVVEAG
jgi:hypothetical protein